MTRALKALARIPSPALGLGAAALVTAAAYGLEALGETAAPAFVLGAVVGLLASALFRAVNRERGGSA